LFAASRPPSSGSSNPFGSEFEVRRSMFDVRLLPPTREHSHHPEVAGAQGCVHDDDLHARPAPGWRRHEKPAGLPIARLSSVMLTCCSSSAPAVLRGGLWKHLILRHLQRHRRPGGSAQAIPRLSQSRPGALPRRLRSAFRALARRLSLYCASIARLLHVSCTTLARLFHVGCQTGPLLAARHRPSPIP
jgi:hypothetical protein